MLEGRRIGPNSGLKCDADSRPLIVSGGTMTRFRGHKGRSTAHAQGRGLGTWVSIAVVVAVVLSTVASSVPIASHSTSRAGPTVPRTPQSKVSVAASPPSPGQLNVFDFGPGPETADPAAANDEVSAGPIMNVFETLISRDTSSSDAFVPTLATCVPGTIQCVSDYGSSLVGVDASGAPQFWTFVIDPAARFYDPQTQAAWGVYPSDVMFSVARDLAWADYPGIGTQTGWELGQALLPYGTTGFGSPYDNSPLNIFSSMLINDTRYCPTLALTQANGCVTFNAYSGGHSWPYFLQILANPLGGSVVPCGWFTFKTAAEVSQGANVGGVPGFPGTQSAGGDGSCLLPGGARSTNDAGYQSFLSTLASGASPTWQAYEQLGLNWPVQQPDVQWNDVGSGPYYAVYAPDSTPPVYTLFANPAYQQPSGCSDSSGLVVYGGTCYPTPGSFQPLVADYFETSDINGINELAAGHADFVTVTAQDLGNVLAMPDSAVVNPSPTTSQLLFPFNMAWNAANYAGLGAVPSANIPSDFFSHIAARELLRQAYMYATTESQAFSTSGVAWMTPASGPIPSGLSTYYPTDIPVPTANADPNPSDPGSAAWWWTAGITPSTPTAPNPYYDPELASCAAIGTQCTFPITGIASGDGGTPIDQAIDIWINEIESITSNHVQPTLIDLPLGTIPASLVDSQLAAPAGSGALPVWTTGWSGYIPPLDGTTSTDGIEEEIVHALDGLIDVNREGIPKLQPAAGHIGNAFSTVSDVRAVLPAVEPLSCSTNSEFAPLWQPTPPAYPSDPTWFATGEVYPDVGVAASDAVCEALSSFTDPTCTGDTASVSSAAYWAGEPFIPDACQGWAYGAALATMEQAAQEPVVTTRAQELDQAERILNSLALYVYGGEPIRFICTAPWIASSTVNTNPMIGGSGDQLWFEVKYAPATVKFVESGLPSGASWSVSAGTPFPVSQSNTTTVDSSGNVVGEIDFSEPTGQLTYSVSAPTGYIALTPKGSINVGASGATVAVAFDKLQSVTFTASGLAGQTTWTVTFAGHTESSSTSSIVFLVPDGTAYAYTISPIPGYTASPSSGTITVGDSDRSISVVFTAVLYGLTFTETGLPSGDSWSVTSCAGTQTSSGATIEFQAPDGTCSYSVTAPIAYSASPASGSVVISGAPVAVGIAFALTLYAVQFVETGLPAGTAWTVALAGVLHTSTASSILYEMSYGEAAFQVTPVSGYTTLPWSGTVTVSGSPVLVNVSFEPNTLTTTFVESGLPTGKTWTVTLNGITQSGSGTQLRFPIGVGTGFPFVVNSVYVGSSGSYTYYYLPAPATGSVAGGATATISFTYHVVIVRGPTGMVAGGDRSLAATGYIQPVSTVLPTSTWNCQAMPTLRLPARLVEPS